MKLVNFLCLLLMLSGCATRTKYAPHSYSGGYSEQMLESGLYISQFAGNARTDSTDAFLFSHFRAIEVCHEMGLRFANFLTSVDKTKSKDVQKSSTYSYQQPTYYSGQINTVDTGQGSGTSSNFFGTSTGGSSSGQTTTWTETYKYPTFETYFTCHKKVFLADFEIRTIPAQEITEFVKDRLSAVQIIQIDKSSINSGTFDVGDIILKVENTRIQNTLEFLKATNGEDEKQQHTVFLVRDGKNIKLNLKTRDSSEQQIEDNRKLIEISCKVPEISNRAICTQTAVK